MARLGVSPGRAYMIGDSAADIEAGKNAGVLTVGATYGFGGRQIIKFRPDYIIEDIIEATYLV